MNCQGANGGKINEESAGRYELGSSIYTVSLLFERGLQALKDLQSISKDVRLSDKIGDAYL